MLTFALYVVLCHPTGDYCNAYVADNHLSQNDCDSYMTDSGVAAIEEKISYYVTDFDSPTVDILSIHCEEQ